MNIIYTVCNRTNLAHSLALAESALKYHSDHTFYLCWTDAHQPTDLPSNVRLLTFSELHLTQAEQMQRDYFDFELLSASRPWFALRLLEKHPQCIQIAFFAPTLLLFGSIQNVLNAESTIFLTPNITEPLKQSAILDDKRILNIGMFHSGSWILRPNKETVALLTWWAERTVDRAMFDLCEGMNGDQLWLNYIPLWNKETTIVRNAGWHYGLHSVLNKKLTDHNGQYQVDGVPLISVDFAGLDFFDPVWSNHAPLVSKNSSFGDLFKDYKKALKGSRGKLNGVTAPKPGKTLEIRKNRILRNNIAKKLKALVSYIDQF